MGKFDNVFIISDIDHTFLADNSTVPQINLDALDYFKSEGGKFTFATGRSHFTLQYAFPNAATLLNTPAIVGNGSYLFDYSCNSISHPLYLDNHCAIEIGQFILKTLPNTGMRILTPEITYYSSVNKYIEAEVAKPWYKIMSEYLSPDQWTGDKWCKIVIRDDPDKLDYLRNKLEIEFKDNDIEICKSEADFLEIQKFGSNKGRGISIIREMCISQGITPKIYACGDYENDLPMMKGADVAVCPDNAHKSVKSIADLCLCHCNDGVIADLIYNYISN